MIVKLHHIPCRMLACLVKEGSMTAKGLAEHLGLSVHLIRFHLLRLKMKSLVGWDGESALATSVAERAKLVPTYP